MIDFTGDFTMTIDGRAAMTTATLAIVNPATAEPFAEAPDAGQADLDHAVAAARAAFPGWAAKALAERSALLGRIAAVLTENLDSLARLLVREQGKPLADARAEIGGTAYWASATAGLDLPVDHADGPMGHSETHHLPLGVVGAIVPWNFPLILAMFKIAPALLAGNTLVVKPSPFTPLTTLKFGELLRDVLPAGVLNVISGGDALGPMMTAHGDIDKISFTGSTATGKRVMQGAAATMKRLTLELGGNDAAIVLPDIDVAAITERLFWAAFKNSGQLCIATKRVYIHDDVYDALSASLAAYARTVVVGDGFDQGVRMGPIQNRVQFDRVQALIANARETGLTFLAGDTAATGPGYFVPVTLIDNPPDDARVVSEEAFGPVLPLMRYRDIDEAVARANATRMGLGGTVWGTDVAQAASVAARLEAGTVTINGPTSPSPLAPFAGHKESGLGAEGGRAGLLSYTNPRTIFFPRETA